MTTAGHIYDAGPRVRPFVLSEAENMRSRDVGTVTVSGTAIKSGTLLAQADNATSGTYAANSGNTGNFTASAVTAGATAKPGVYKGVFVAATKFEVEDPDGKLVAVGTTGSAFSSGGLGFTITAGATPAVAGDGFSITVAAGTGKYVPYQAAGAVGPAAAILYEGTDAVTADVKKVVINCDAEVNRFELTGLDTAAEADLRKLGIKVRGQTGTLEISTPAL